MLKSYHMAWLSAHPNRSARWLREKIKDGFHIHHKDGDHNNNDPNNLLLIDGDDHMRLHGVSLESGIESWRVKDRRRQEVTQEARRIYDGKAAFGGKWIDFAKIYYGGEKISPRPWASIGESLANKARKYAERQGLVWPPSG